MISSVWVVVNHQFGIGADSALALVALQFRDIVVGLCHLHSIGVVHCDISPQNVFMRKGPGDMLECVLGDFGNSYIEALHDPTRSSIAHHGTSFVAPGACLLTRQTNFSF